MASDVWILDILKAPLLWGLLGRIQASLPALCLLGKPKQSLGSCSSTTGSDSTGSQRKFHLGATPGSVKEMDGPLP